MMLTCPICALAFRVNEVSTLDREHCPRCQASVPRASRAKPSGPTPRPAPPLPGAGVELQRTCKRCGERYPARDDACPACGGLSRAAAERAAMAQREAWAGLEFERLFAELGPWGGVIALAVAAMWFFAGLKAGVIFFYPPFLAVFGIVLIFLSVSARRTQSRRDAAKSRNRAR